MWRLIFGKYKDIIAAIAVFIILDTGVLVLNFYTTYQISDDAHAIHLASRQTMLTQRIFYSVSQVQSDLERGVNFEKNTAKLAISYKQFDEILDAFIYGGNLIGQGLEQDDLLVDPLYQELSGQYLKEVEALWKPYRPLVSALVYAEYFDDDLDTDALLIKANLASAYAAKNGDKLLNLVSDFSQAVEDKAHAKTIQLRTVQGVAITLAVINFFIILFHFIKRLNRSDELVQRVQKETTEIMQTVPDGLFLLNSNYEIGSQCSSSMNTLFKQSDFSGVVIFDLLEPRVSKDTLGIAKDYIDSLFNARVKSSLMHDLNPLQEVEMNIVSQHGLTSSVFSFNFTRVYEDNVIVHLLVSVKDVTDNVELRKQLEESRNKGSQETESLLSLLSIDSVLLKEFLASMSQYLMFINNELEKPEFTILGFVKKLENISRYAHSLKGEASMLGLHFIERKTHALEDTLALIKNKSEIQGDDFLPITVQLNELVKAEHSIRLIVSHSLSVLHSLNSSPKEHQQDVNVSDDDTEINVPPLQSALGRFSDDIAQHYGKRVKTDFSSFSMDLLPEHAVPVIKSVLAQLIRNAVVHGLEKPEKRLERGKSPIGTIALSVNKNADYIVVAVRDDGRGIDFKAIKSHLLQSGKYNPSEVDEMTPRELVKFIFRSDFSTAKQLDQHAGRGVGLDAVKRSLDNINATLTVSCKARQSTEFSIRIPAVLPVSMGERDFETLAGVL